MATVITNSNIIVDGAGIATLDSDTIVLDNANNRVGIGTTPGKKLHVYRNDTATDAQVLIEQEGTGDATIGFLKTGVYNWMTGLDNTDNKYKISGSGSGLGTNNYLSIDTDGNVIVTASFTQKFTDSDLLWTDINSGANPYTPMSNELVIQNDALNVTNSMASIFFRPGQTTAGLQVNTARIAAVREAGFDTSLAFSTRGNGAHAERMRILHDGKVGINHTEPEAFLHVDDKDGTGPTVIFEGGGTNQNTPADGEQTLFLKTGDGTGDLSTGIGFFATFENTPGDTNDRRATDIRAGFDGGSWGTEYMSFHIGKGTGSTNNDAGAMTDERLKITKTAVTATVPINDDKGDVRQAPVSSQTATFTVPSGSSGEMFRIAGSVTNININVANFAEGDIVTLVNVSGTNTPTLTFDAWSNGVRIAGGDGTNLASTSTTTLDVWGVVTLIAIASTRLTINGNVS